MSKAALKKKKIYEKFKNNSEKMMNIMATKSLLFSVDENEDLCLTCHEKSKPNNKLVYFSSVKKDITLACQYYKHSESKVLFSSCMHTIHTGCFVKFIKKIATNIKANVLCVVLM